MSVATIATVPGVRPFVEIGVGSVNEPVGGAAWQPAAGGPLDSRWQAAGGSGDSWVGQDSFWWDITCDTLDISTMIGRERAVETWPVGSATIVVRNSTGWADFPPSDPEQTFLTVRPGRPIRIGVQVGLDAPVLLWGGYIDATAPGFDAVEGETMTFECIDAKGEAGRTDLEELVAAVGAGEPAHTRVGRILNAIFWPTFRRNLEATGVTVKATKFGARAIDLMDLAADSSAGVVYGDVNGAVVYRFRDWQALPASPQIDATIANFGLKGPTITPDPLVEDPPGSGLYQPLLSVEAPAGSGLYDPVGALVEAPPGSDLHYPATITPAPVEACPISWDLAFAREDISTKVIVGRHDDAEQEPPIPAVVREDADARNIFGSESFERVDLETELHFDLVTLADRVLHVRSWKYMPRVAAVTLDASTDAGVAAVLAAADPHKPAVFRCRHRGINDRTVFSRTMIVMGVEHSITPEGWTARIALDDARPFMGVSEAGWSTARWNNAATPNALASAWSRTV